MCDSVNTANPNLSLVIFTKTIFEIPNFGSDHHRLLLKQYLPIEIQENVKDQLLRFKKAILKLQITISVLDYNIVVNKLSKAYFE